MCLKIEKNKNLTIYLLRDNLSNFRTYLKDKYRKKVTRHYIDKQNISGDIDRGIIFLYEEILALPEWVSYLTTLSEKDSIKVSPKRVSKAVLFLTLKGPQKKTFAITFGNGSALLDSEYIVPDFGLKVSKSLLTLGEIISIDSTSIDRKIFNTKKQSAAFLMPEKLLEYGSQNIIRNIYGVYKEFNKKFSLGGNESLNFKGNIDLLTDIEKWLTQFVVLYSTGQNNLGISDDLIIADTKEKDILDNKLSEKILNIINANPITGRQIPPLKISPNEVFDLKKFNGFFISGLGYKKSKVSSDFFIDEVDFFERFKRHLKLNQKNKEGVLRKIKTDKIYRKVDDQGELEPVCSIYKAINYEVTYNFKRYILIFGKWYEINREYYSTLKKEIDEIEAPDTITSIEFIDFDEKKHYDFKSGKKHLSEGKYNENLAKKNQVLMLDRKDYRVDLKTMKKYGFKSQSSIEICDVIDFNKDKIQFIHVKRHSGASGTSHLLTQALVSAHAFINDNKAVTAHINAKIEDFNSKNKSYTLPKLKYKEQKKEVILAIIDKNVTKENSKLLSLLEMISLRENIRTLEHLGFKCYLKFIPGNK